VKPGRAAVSLGFLVCVAVGAFAASEENQDARAFFKRALKAHEQKDYPGFVENMEAALKLRPNHQVYMYDLAAGYALAGKKEQAIALLSRAVALGFVFPEIEKDADFSSLRGQDDFDAVLKKFAENRRPISHSEPAFSVHEKGLVPEGLAYDPNTKTFFLGSVYQRKIVAVNAANEARDFSRDSECDGNEGRSDTSFALGLHSRSYANGEREIGGRRQNGPFQIRPLQRKIAEEISGFR
jgi:tetratricopeptide (TPR) repeat protein